MISQEGTVPVFGEAIRKEFMLRDDSVFLNHGSFGTVPRCVHERQVRYLTEMEAHPDTWFRYNMYKYLESSKVKVAEFMGIQPEDTVLLQNVTKAINTVMKTFPLTEGDAYLMTSFTYDAVKMTAHAAISKVEGARLYEMEIKFPINCDDHVVEIYEEFLGKHPDVKLAVVDHISSIPPIVWPVKRIMEVCHRHGVVVVVDAAHVPGQLKVDIQDIDADFYTGNLHKWLFCPRSCAFIWMNPKRRHTWFKPLVTSKFHNHQLDEAFSYEGTKDDTPYICSADAIDYYHRLGGMEKIVQYNSSLVTNGLAYLEEQWGTRRLAVPRNMEAPFLRMLHLPAIPGFSDNLDVTSSARNTCGKDCKLQKLLLDKYDVQVSVDIIQGQLMVRITAQVYNTMQDYIRLSDAVISLTEEKEE